MRWTAKLNVFMLVLSMLVFSYLAMVFWYFITRIIKQDVIDTSGYFFDALNGLILIVLPLLICYFFFRVYKKLK